MGRYTTKAAARHPEGWRFRSLSEKESRAPFRSALHRLPIICRPFRAFHPATPQRGDITQAGGGVRSTTLGKTDASIVLLSLNRSLPSTLARRRPKRAKAHSPGQRPGLHDARGSPPCKGKSFCTYSAKNLMATQKPRAMPWAMNLLPLRGAHTGFVLYQPIIRINSSFVS